MDPVEGTYRSPTGSFSTIDHVWSSQPPASHGDLAVHCHHWGCIPNPSPHAILHYRVSGLSLGRTASAQLPSAVAATYSVPVRVRLNEAERERF